MGNEIYMNKEKEIVQFCYENNLAGIKKLVEEGGISLEHALLEASFKGRLEIVKYLVERGADIDSLGFLSLEWLEQRGHRELVSYIKKQAIIKKLTCL